MDAFYASVEQRDDPALRGRPVIVGGTGGRGVVAAASYEVRKFGVHSAMPMREALRRCPDAVCVHPRISHYAEESRQIFAVFHEFTPLVQGLSLDEAFLDVTGSIAVFGPAEQIAREIKRLIRERTELTASVGVAPNKLVAKIASDLRKPDGLVVVRPGRGPATARSAADPTGCSGSARRRRRRSRPSASTPSASCSRANRRCAQADLRSLHRACAAARRRHRRSPGRAGPRREADQRRGDLRDRHRGPREAARRDRATGGQDLCAPARARSWRRAASP